MSDAPLLLGAVPLLVGSDPVRLPDAFLRPFVDGGVLTLWLDGCLALWPAAAWRDIAERVAALPLASSEARTFARLLFASAVPVRDGAVVVPEPLRVAAGIEGEAVLVGVGARAELWAAGRWAAIGATSLDGAQLAARDLIDAPRAAAWVAVRRSSEGSGAEIGLAGR